MALYNIIPALTPYIKVISSIENTGAAGASAFRVLPDTCAEFFFNYSNGAIANIHVRTPFTGTGSFVTSRLASYMDVEILPHAGTIAVCCKPGAAFYFFNLPMKELTDTNVLLADIWGAKVQELEESLHACSHNHERVQLIQQFLHAIIKNRVAANNEYEYCLWQINLLRGQIPVGQLAKKINISQRQLSRQFNNFLGVPPKEFARVTRFVSSLEQFKKQPGASLTHIAYESGYFDQAHFIHDCREFTGMTPGELVAARRVVY